MKQTDRTYKFGIIGQGHIGKRHAEMVRRNKNCELIAVCDILTKEQTGNATISEPYYSSHEEMFHRHPEIEIASICTPNGLHALHSKAALMQGKHIVCEKPMALHTIDCKDILALATQQEKQIFCVMQNRYSPPAVWLKELVSQKRLGEIFLVQLNCYWNRDERYYKKGGWKGSQELDGGTLFTQFSHFIDIMYWLFGDIEAIQARFADFNHQTLTEFEDSGLVTFKFKTGGIGSINYSTAVWNHNLESSISIIGSKGTVKVGGQYMDKVEHCHIQDYNMPELQPTSPPNDYGDYKGSANNHHFIIQNVVDTLDGKTTKTTTGEEGLHVVDIIERIYNLRAQNRKS